MIAMLFRFIWPEAMSSCTLSIAVIGAHSVPVQYRAT